MADKIFDHVDTASHPRMISAEAARGGPSDLASPGEENRTAGGIRGLSLALK